MCGVPRGRRLPDAVTLAKAYVTEAIRGGFPVGHGAGPTDHFFYLRLADLAAWVRRLRLRGAGGEVGRRPLVMRVLRKDYFLEASNSSGLW